MNLSPWRIGAVPEAVSPAAKQQGIAFVLTRLAEWRARARQRRQLMALDERLLRDIGLSRADIEAEYLKAPWRG